MNANDLPLVFFTLLSQLSTGLIVAGLVFMVFLRDDGFMQSLLLKRHILMISLVLMGAALLISFLHLARPAHSIFALSQLSRSWLSREILLGGIYFFSLAVAFVSLRISFIEPGTWVYIYAASVVTGVILIWSMTRLYMLPTVPVWDHPSTALGFATTAIAGGGLLGLMLLPSLRIHISDEHFLQAVNLMFYMASLGVLLHALNLGLIQPDTGVSWGSFSPPLIPFWLRSAHFMLLFLGFSLLVFWYARHSAGPLQLRPLLLYLAASMLLLAELSARIIFYASYQRLGV